MTWTYNPFSIGDDSDYGRLYSVRSLIQDNIFEEQQLQDEEILFYLSQTGDDVYAASSMACDALAARYSRYGDTSIDNGGISVDYRDVVENYRIMSGQMRKLAQKYGTGGLGVPRAGGISRSGMLDVYQDSDRVDPAFRQRQFRNPPTLNSDDDDDRIR